MPSVPAREHIDTALLDRRLFVKVDGEWEHARQIEYHVVGNGTWVMRLEADGGRRGFITNADNNAGGFEFIIAPFRVRRSR